MERSTFPKKVGALRYRGRGASFGLSGGVLGWSGLTQAADAEAPRTLPTLLLPDHYRINDDGTLLFSLESGARLSLNEEQYLQLDGGLVLVVDDLAQDAMAELPVLGLLRTQLLTEPVRSPDGSIVEVSSSKPLWSGEGPAPRLFEDLDLETHEIAQSPEAVSATDDSISSAVVGGAGLVSGLGALLSLFLFGNGTANGTSSSSPMSSASGPSGTLTKGPLSNAFVFIDTNANGVHDPDEPSTTTDASGNFSFPADSPEGPLVAVTTDATIDTASGTTLAGMTFRAPAGASVITPLTTLMEESGLDADQLKASLGLPANIDPLTFNPFAAGANAADALAVEKVAVQVTTALGAFSAAAEGAGADPDEAFAAAVAALSSTLQSKQSGGTILDLTDSSDLASVQTAFTAQANNLTGIDTAKLSAVAGDTTTAIENVNDAVGAITNTDLSDQSNADIFGLLQVLQDQVEDAAETGGSIELTDPTKVDDAASNAAPLDIRLAKSVNPVTDTSLTIGWLTTKDEETADPNFTYELVNIAGSDYGLLDVDPSTGQLSLKSSPVNGATYDFTVKATDEGGKSFSKTFNIQISPPHDYSILDHDPFRTRQSEDGYFFAQSHQGHPNQENKYLWGLFGSNGTDYITINDIPEPVYGVINLKVDLREGENYSHFMSVSPRYKEYQYHGGDNRDFVYTGAGSDKFNNNYSNRIFDVGNGDNYWHLDLSLDDSFNFEYMGGNGKDTVKSGGYWYGQHLAWGWHWKKYREIDFGKDQSQDSLYLNDSFTYFTGEMSWYLKNFNPYHDKIFISGSTPKYENVTSYSIDFPGQSWKRGLVDWNKIVLDTNYDPSIIESAIIYTQIPKFSKGLFASYSITENTKFVFTQPAIDPDGELLTYSRRLDRDGSLFEIDEQTGTLSFKSAPDFGVPRDFSRLPGDNIYEVEVVAEDPNGATATQVVSVTVTDEFDPELWTDADVADSASVFILGGTEDLADFVGFTAASASAEASPLSNLGKGSGNVATITLGNGHNYLNVGENAASDYGRLIYTGGTGSDQLSFGDNLAGYRGQASIDLGLDTADDRVEFLGQVANAEGSVVDIYNFDVTDNDIITVPFSYDLVYLSNIGAYMVRDASFAQGKFIVHGYGPQQSTRALIESNILTPDLGSPNVVGDNDVSDSATVSIIGENVVDDFIGFSAASLTATDPLSYLGSGSGSVATISLGNGRNYLRGGDNAAQGGQVKYTGGAGLDDVEFGSYLAVSPNGQASFDLGDGTNTFSAGSSVGYYSGVFGYTGGSGNDTVTLGMSVGGAGGAATFTMGNGSNTLYLGDLAASSGGSIQYTGGTGADTISFGDMFASSGSATVDLGSDSAVDTITFQGSVGTASPVLIQNFDAYGEDRLVLASVPVTEYSPTLFGVDMVSYGDGVRITANQGMIDLKIEGREGVSKFSVHAAATGVEIV